MLQQRSNQTNKDANGVFSFAFYSASCLERYIFISAIATKLSKSLLSASERYIITFILFRKTGKTVYNRCIMAITGMKRRLYILYL